MNCTQCCPKGLDPAKSIVRFFSRILGRSIGQSRRSLSDVVAIAYLFNFQVQLKKFVSEQYTPDWENKVAEEMKKNVDRAGGLSYA